MHNCKTETVGTAGQDTRRIQMRIAINSMEGESPTDIKLSTEGTPV